MTPAARWPIGIVAVLAIGVAVNGYVLYRATATPTPIETDYYRKAIAWDSTMAQATRNQALGWHLTGRLGVDGRVVARVDSRDGEPIAGADVRVEAFPVVSSDGGATIALAPLGADYSGQVALPTRGLYELRFAVLANGDRFTSTLRGFPGGSLEAKP